MAFWKIILLTNGLLGLVSFYFLIKDIIEDKKHKRPFFWKGNLLSFFICLFFIPAMIIGGAVLFLNYLKEIKKDGGLFLHYKKEKAKKEERLREEKEFKTKEEERDHLREEYEKGNISRNEIPRTLDGVRSFEFSEKLDITTNYGDEVRDIVYVENEYCESINRFFMTHKGLRLYHMYRFIYLPTLCKELEESENNELVHYLYPNIKKQPKLESLDSTYPIQFLCYPEDAKKITHGMMFLQKSHPIGCCIPFFTGDYFHLEEGTDEEILKQLDDIVHQVHNLYGHGGLYYTVKKPDLPEGKTKKYADELFSWVVYDDNIALVTEEIRRKIQSLKAQGIAQKLLIKIMPEEPSLSRLIITKDFRIILPDYQDMEIKMEPLNKAVFLLFLKHPEGIIFKHLTDYRKELIEIYKQLKPSGITERALHSIEDVTNPTLNSINEKCARIRGAFISKFDEELAKNYFITGQRGEAKRILLPRDMVMWEDEDKIKEGV